MIAVMYWLYNEVLSYIDARNLAQQQLEKFNADLQAMVDDRTRELVEANRELQQFALRGQPRFAGAAQNHHQLFAINGSSL